MFEIREIKSCEYEFLREMLYEAIYVPDETKKPPRSIVFEPRIAQYFENFGRAGDYAFVLVGDGDLAGAAWARLFGKTAGNYGFVDQETPEISMAIRENWRGKGFGTNLLDKLLKKLKAEGFHQASLSVDRRNRALDLYRKFGFEIVSEKGTALTMLKKLS